MHRCHLLLILCLAAIGCTGTRLSADEARKKIAELGTSKLVPDAIEIRRIVSQTDNQAIAESTVTLAFQFKKNLKTGQWEVAAVRLGDRDWVNTSELLTAINEGRRRETTAGMEKLSAGIVEYRRRNGALPIARDIVSLTDELHPRYMTDLVRTDAWGHPIEYQVTGSTFRLVSRGSDGILSTPDDIVLNGNPSDGP
jgi:hypothetical protein